MLKFSVRQCRWRTRDMDHGGLSCRLQRLIDVIYRRHVKDNFITSRSCRRPTNRVTVRWYDTTGSDEQKNESVPRYEVHGEEAPGRLSDIVVTGAAKEDGVLLPWNQIWRIQTDCIDTKWREVRKVLQSCPCSAGPSTIGKCRRLEDGLITGWQTKRNCKRNSEVLVHPVAGPSQRTTSDRTRRTKVLFQHQGGLKTRQSKLPYRATERVQSAAHGTAAVLVGRLIKPRSRSGWSGGRRARSVHERLMSAAAARRVRGASLTAFWPGRHRSPPAVRSPRRPRPANCARPFDTSSATHAPLCSPHLTNRLSKFLGRFSQLLSLYTWPI